MNNHLFRDSCVNINYSFVKVFRAGVSNSFFALFIRDAILQVPQQGLTCFSWGFSQELFPLSWLLHYLGLSGPRSELSYLLTVLPPPQRNAGTNPRASTILFRAVIPAITFCQPLLHTRLTGGRGSALLE